MRDDPRLDRAEAMKGRCGLGVPFGGGRRGPSSRSTSTPSAPKPGDHSSQRVVPPLASTRTLKQASHVAGRMGDPRRSRIHPAGAAYVRTSSEPCAPTRPALRIGVVTRSLRLKAFRRAAATRHFVAGDTPDGGGAGKSDLLRVLAEVRPDFPQGDQEGEGQEQAEPGRARQSLDLPCDAEWTPPKPPDYSCATGYRVSSRLVVENLIFRSLEQRTVRPLGDSGPEGHSWFRKGPATRDGRARRSPSMSVVPGCRPGTGMLLNLKRRARPVLHAQSGHLGGRRQAHWRRRSGPVASAFRQTLEDARDEVSGPIPSVGTRRNPERPSRRRFARPGNAGGRGRRRRFDQRVTVHGRDRPLGGGRWARSARPVPRRSGRGPCSAEGQQRSSVAMLGYLLLRRGSAQDEASLTPASPTPGTTGCGLRHEEALTPAAGPWRLAEAGARPPLRLQTTSSSRGAS